MTVATARGAPAGAVGSDRAPYETGAYKWYVAAVLCAAHTISMVDRFVMVLVSEPLRAAMALTDTQLGLLQGTGFALLYCAFALPLGCIADVVNRRKLIMAGLIFWSLATVAAAFTTSFATLFLTRILVGLGEACLIPAGMSLLAAYFAPSNLARGTAIFGMGANFGFGVAFIGGGALLAGLTAAGGLAIAGAQFAPWQGVFLVAGLAAAPVLVMFIWLREPPRTTEVGRMSLADHLAGMRRGVGYILSNIRAYLPFLAVAAATSATGYAMSSWSTSLWVRLHDLSPADAGKLVGLIGVLIGPLGSVAGGIVLDRMQARGVAGAPLVLMGAGAVAVVLIVAGFVLVPGRTAGLIFFGLFMFESFFVLPSVYVGMQMLTSDDYRGVAASFNMMVYSLCGLGLGPTAVGAVSDLLSGPSSLGIAVLVVEIAMAAVIIPIVIFCRRSFQARVAQVQAMA